MNIYAGPLLLALLGLSLVPACSDDVPAGEGVPTCGAVAEFSADALELEWQWTTGQVVSIPVVADVDGDALPDIIVNITRTGSDELSIGELALLDGTTGELKWRITHDPAKQRFGSQGRSTVAAADVDGDGISDIVYAGRSDSQGDKRSPIHAVDGQGNLLWTSHNADGTLAMITVEIGAAAVANLDADPGAEIVFGAAVLDHDGLVVWDQDGNGGVFGTPTDNLTPPKRLYTGGLSTLVDLDADGKPEILSGRDAWKIAWTPGAPPSVTVSRLWQDTSGKGNDGWPAVADLDNNGSPEVVLVAWPDIKVLDGRTGAPWCGADPSGKLCQDDPSSATAPVAIAGGNIGGPPTLADFDGDGFLEAAISGGTAFALYDFNRPDEEVVVAPTTPQPAPGAIFVRWQATIQDNSSSANGSVAFDFDQDGLPELLHQDECSFRVLAGATGAVLGQITNSSMTGHEYPIVADIDADGHTEILVVANHSIPAANESCRLRDPDFTTRQGVFAYGPGEQNWATARRSWPQFNHHATDVDPEGRVPQAESPHFADPATNGFRQASLDPEGTACE
jgi:hypothetical protein